MIETARLRCETLSAVHADAMYPVLLDEKIYRYIPESRPGSLKALRDRYEWLSAGRSEDGAERWLNWMLFDKVTAAPIGYYQATIRGPDCWVGYVLNPSFWGQGYAGEAGRAIISALFEAYDLRAVTAEIHVENAASVALARRLGFLFVGHDEAENDDVFELTRERWQQAA